MIFEQRLSLPTIDQVNRFHRGISLIDCDVDLVTENFRYTIDAKSIMGIFSLDLTKPVILKAYTDDPRVIQQIKDLIKEFEC